MAPGGVEARDYRLAEVQKAALSGQSELAQFLEVIWQSDSESMMLGSNKSLRSPSSSGHFPKVS